MLRRVNRFSLSLERFLLSRLRGEVRPTLRQSLIVLWCSIEYLQALVHLNMSEFDLKYRFEDGNCTISKCFQMRFPYNQGVASWHKPSVKLVGAT